MAYDRKPLYHFTDATKTGIDKVPEDRVIYIEDTAILYTKVSDTGLTGTSTITDAITNGNIIELINIPPAGNLDSDGTIPMDVGYAPVNDQDIATKVSVTEEINNNSLFDAALFRAGL